MKGNTLVLLHYMPIFGKKQREILAVDLPQAMGELGGNSSVEDTMAGLSELMYGYQRAQPNSTSANYGDVNLCDEDANQGSNVAVIVTSSNTLPLYCRRIQPATDGHREKRVHSFLSGRLWLEFLSVTVYQIFVCMDK